MLRAIIFDFNGIILNDEPLHFASMREAVAARGLHLTPHAYWEKYLPFDDVTCLQAIFRDHNMVLSEEQQGQILDLKSAVYQNLLKNEYPLCAGAADFIRSSAAIFPLALASGARRDEIVGTLKATGLFDYFKVIVGAEDFRLGKPNPESYLLALELLNRTLNGRSRTILPDECLVIEDSIGGVRGARAAGMWCLAVANTYPPERLGAANRVVSSLEEVRAEGLESLLQEGT